MRSYKDEFSLIVSLNPIQTFNPNEEWCLSLTQMEKNVNPNPCEINRFQDWSEQTHFKHIILRNIMLIFCLNR